MQTFSSPVAVISGDVVQSTALSTEQYDALLTRIKLVQQWISQGHSQNLHSINRGDEFQSLVLDTEHALRYVLLYRLAIKALGKPYDCRVSFAIGSNTQIRETIGESMGNAFVLSGRKLRSLKQHRLVFDSESSALTEQFTLLFKYLDKQLSELTARQCEVLLPMLKNHAPLTIGELADELHIAAATASKSLKASGWPLINELNGLFTERVKGLVND